MSGQEWYWMSARVCVCVSVRLLSTLPTSCVSDYHTAIISGLSLFLLFPLHHPSLVRSSAQNRARSHAEGTRGSTERLRLTPQNFLTPRPLPPHFSNTSCPQKHPLFSRSVHNASPSSSIYIYLSHAICLSRGSQLEPYVSFTQRPSV